MASVAMAVMLLVVGSSANSSPAVVPSTLNGIHLWFGMQGRMSTTQAEAVSAASAGDMVSALPIQIHWFGAAMKAVNPNVKLFAYQNGMFSQAKDCSTFPASWYLYDARGAKVQAAKTGNCLMNPMSTQTAFGAAGWTQYVEQQCASALADPNTSGCFLDQMNAAPMGSGFVNGAPIDPRTNQPFTNTAYMQMVAAHGQAVASKLGAPVVGNAYDSAPRYYGIPTSIVNQASGIVVDEAEHWFGNDITQADNTAAWQQAVQMEIDAQAAGHGTILNVDAPGPNPEQWRSYMAASYLLGNNGGAWLEFAPNGTTAPFDSLSPLYNLPVGTPTETYSKVQGYAVGGYYRRDYTHGMVLANPSGSSVTVNLGGTYVDVTGQQMTSITLAAWSGAVLVSADGGPPPPVAPSNTHAPSISGTAASGSTLTASAGTWTGTPAPTFSYQWQQCDSANVCTDVAGSTGQTYAVTDADNGLGLRVEVTAQNSAGSATADSAIVSVTAPPPPVAPSDTQAPSISGTAASGSTLTASAGTWTGTPDPTFSYQWQQCDSANVCTDVAGSTNRTYAVSDADNGLGLRVEVTAQNSAGSAMADSAIVAVAAPPSPVAPDNTAAPQVSGAGSVGSTLTASPGTWTGTPDPTLSYQWQQCDSSGACSDMSGATGKRYVVTAADAGLQLRVDVTGTNTAGSAGAHSSQLTVPAVQPVNVISLLTFSSVRGHYRVMFRLSAPATVTVTFVNASGTVVRHQVNGVRMSAGMHRVCWSGRTDARVFAPGGSYRAVVTAVSAGKTWTQTSSALTVR
jgi:hypothetical protein